MENKCHTNHDLNNSTGGTTKMIVDLNKWVNVNQFWQWFPRQILRKVFSIAMLCFQCKHLGNIRFHFMFKSIIICTRYNDVMCASRQTYDISRTLAGLDHSYVVEHHHLSVLLKLHLHSRLDTLLKWIGQSQLQHETGNISVSISRRREHSSDRGITYVI